MIPYGKQDINEEDIAAVVDTLRSDFITQGPQIPAFEKALCEYTGAQHACAVNSATSALHIACLALDLGPGDHLWTSPNTFVASANVGLYCGAQVDFVDINPRTYNMDVARLQEKLEYAEKQGCLPKVVIPVHFAGQSCEMQRIRELADQYGFAVIEDASHAIGGEYQGKKTGCLQYADLAVFSFHPVKIVTTGEGGAVLCNNDELHEKLVRLRSHGVTRDPAYMAGEPDGAWDYHQIELGFNYRITDIQAALGASQLKRLDTFIQRRRQLARQYDDLLADFPLQTPWQHPDTQSAWHLYVIRLELEQLDNNRSDVFDALRASGIGVNVHYIPVHWQPWYRRQGFRPGDFPQAEHYYRGAITLPMYPRLSDAEQQTVIEKLELAMS